MSSPEPLPGRLCPVCRWRDPDHDWDVHEAQPLAPFPDPEGLRGASMLSRSSSRGAHRVRVLALHTTEGITRAADLLAWTGWAGSSHASADAGGVLLTPADGFVPYDRASWTLRSGNPWSENIELCGFAKWTRADWLSRPKLLDATARWLADRSRVRGIPLVKLTAQQYRAGLSGVIDHDDHTVGYQDGTHWDVGEQFPWDVVLSAARYAREGAPVPNTTTEDDVLQMVNPGTSAVIPLPPGRKAVTLAVDEADGGANVRVAMGWGRTPQGQAQYAPLRGMDKVDGFTGWAHNATANRWELTESAQTLTITHAKTARHPLGVLVTRA